MLKFKVGDKVRVIKSCSKVGENGCGNTRCIFLKKIGIITEIEKWFNSERISVKNFKNMDGRWCNGFTKDCLELFKKEIKKYGITFFLDNLKK